MGCISSIAKYLIFLFNFLIAIGGIVLIIFGSISLVNSYKALDEVFDYSIGGFSVAVGVIIFFIAFLGCCGAIKENSCMLTTYATILIVLFIVQLALGILAFVAIKNDDGELQKSITDELQKIFDKRSDKDKMDTIDEVQKGLKCCGVKSPMDYPSLKYPASCCGEKEPYSCSKPYKDGCGEALTDFIMDNSKIIGGIAIGFCVVELIAAIFACMVRNNHRHSSHY